MPDNVANGPGSTGSTDPAKSADSPDEDLAAREPDSAEPDEDPGYLVTTGEAASADGTVVPIIGGLPAAEGSAWDIGAPADERGAGLAEEQEGQADPDK